MCAEGLEKFFENMEKIDPLMHDATTRHFEQGSKAMESLGERWNMPLLANDARLYQDDPEKGLGRASAITASFMAPYALGGLGAAAGAAGGAAEAVSAAEAAQQAAQQISMMEMVEPIASEGLLATNTPSSLEMGGLLQNSTMESGLMDTGYTPSNLYQAFNNANSANGTPLEKNMGQWADQMKTDLLNGSMKNRVGSNLQNQNKLSMMRMGSGMMNPQPQQQTAMPPPRQQVSSEPLQRPYHRPPPGQDPRLAMLSEEEKQRLRAMGVRI